VQLKEESKDSQLVAGIVGHAVWCPRWFHN
ncbi:uncharacterized protein METZ01_LOCUS367283, partial [marine metagenome]